MLRSQLKGDMPTTTPSSDEDLWELVGGLSQPSKMPCWSYGLPPEACKTGGYLRANVPDSVCARCYSFRGRSHFPSVKDSRQRRLESLAHPHWVYAMVELIKMYTPIGNPYFRWHDSGDIQNDQHFEKICQVARLLPQVNFWLPTQESRYCRWPIPENLVLRVSAPLLGGHAREDATNISSVLPKELGPVWEDLVKRSNDFIWRCPAPLDKAFYNCGSCRACWDPEVYHVQYLEY